MLYYFHPAKLSPESIASELGLELHAAPPFAGQFYLAGELVGWVVRRGRLNKIGRRIQWGAIDLSDEIVIPPTLELKRV